MTARRTTVVHAAPHPTEADARTQLNPGCDAGLAYHGIWQPPPGWGMAAVHLFSTDPAERFEAEGWTRTEVDA